MLISLIKFTSEEFRDLSSICQSVNSVAGAGEEGRTGQQKQICGTTIYPFMEDTKQCANSNTLIHQVGLLQLLRQAHSHQLQQVGVPQLATEEKVVGTAQARRT